MKLSVLFLPFIATGFISNSLIIDIPDLPIYDDDYKSVVVEFDPIGPYEAYGPDKTIHATITSGKYYSNVRERLSVGIAGENYIYFSATAAHDLVYSTPYDLTFTLPISTMLSSKGMSCRIEVVNEGNVTMKSFIFTIMPIPHQRIVPTSYVRDYFRQYDVVLKPNDLFSRMEAIRFSNYIDYFSEDNYYRLSLNHLHIDYASTFPFPGCEATLKFVDYNRIFTSLDSGDSVPIVEIPLRVVNPKKSEICFDFPQNMYVNPNTLEMSLVAKPNYVLTNHFFLPINKKDLLVDQVFTIEVTNFGYGKTSFDWNLTYLNNRGLIGDCDNSDYCVVGDMG